MKIRRFKIDPDRIQGRQTIISDPGEIRHLCRVLRLKTGDRVALFDGQGKEYPATIAHLSPQQVTFSLLPEASPSSKDPGEKIILGLGVLKSSKIDFIVQKATELGVAEFIPFYSLRVVPKWDEAQTRMKRLRWEKIATEAAKQCGRAIVPKIYPPLTFVEALNISLEQAVKIFLWEQERERVLKDVLLNPSKTIFALVGPEGGFSESEALQAKEAGFHPVSLGPRILRAETAALVILSLLQFIRGDIG
jgi:16S rRNA (uracil1498-N3)-methyltransferase